VRDAAEGTIAAMRQGRAGERYLLGGPNWTFEELFGKLERLSKVPGPKLKLPEKVALAGATLLEQFYRWRGNEPPVDRVSYEMAQVFWYCDPSKARRELGFDARDPLETLDDTVRDIQRRFPTKPARERRG
jgi:dihydroflavonol-4-reductase